jgi:UDP-N-acetylmuramoyl-tripeptide--D-alanyl-D-alanine ligase
MRRLTLDHILAATGGTLRGHLDGRTAIGAVRADASLVARGDLYVAVPGEPLDGHELVPVAALRGAAVAIVSESWSRGAHELALPLVVVPDPVVALQRLAAAQRARLAPTVVGITGSVGKTSTKEAAASVLARRFRTYRSPGNWNNELGVPLSLLELDERDQVAVLELAGGYAPGELDLLARIARPDVAVVTNVHPVHLERMGSIDAIAETKAELVDAVAPDGIAVLNADDPRVRAMAGRCRGRVLTYGRTDGSDVRADAVALRGLDGCSFDLVVDGERHPTRTSMLGPHAVDVALAAAAVGHALGLAADELVAGIEAASPVRIRPRPGARGSLIIDDAYNASPPSVRSALALLEQCPGRRIAVLGDMLELGPLAEQEHRAVGRHAAVAADVLVTFGEHAAEIAAAAHEQPTRPAQVVHFEPSRRAELVACLLDLVGPGDVVLIKGSRSLRLDELVDALCEQPAG